MQYLFGDTDLAAQRLKLLADVFADSTRPFLQEISLEKPQLVVDLGCGPGFTTHLLAETFQPEHTVGLDNSPHFIKLAQKSGTNQVTFYLHNVLASPFPVGPADLLFCRLLLTHLTQPRAILETWATQLHSGGLLLLEEVDSIETTAPLFTTYLDIVEAMLAHQDSHAYVGRLLHGLPDIPLLKRRTSALRRLPVPTSQAAALFFMNIQTWKTNPFVQANYEASQLAELEQDLDKLRRKTDGASEIEWDMRQIIFERV